MPAKKLTIDKQDLKIKIVTTLFSLYDFTKMLEETGAQIPKLHTAYNLTKNEWDRGVTFIELMRQNLSNLRIGLQCQ